MKPWYHDPDVLKSRLIEHGGNVKALAAATGVPRTTISEWKSRLGIKLTYGQIGSIESPDVELLKQNEVLKLENKRLREHATKSAAGEVEANRLASRLEDAISQWRPQWEGWKPPPPRKGSTAQDLVLLYSDLHAAEVVSLEETRGLNEYDWNIMEDRMGMTQDAVYSHVEHFGFDVKTLHIHMLGDMLSGNIHAELAMTNDRPLAQAVVDLAELHIPWLLGFAEYFSGSKIVVAGVPGNHPRAWIKPQAKQAHDNADWIFYNIMALALKGHPQFEFSFPAGAMNVQMIAKRWRVLMLHGDGIRSSMPGVPWGGVIRRVTALEAQFNNARQPLDYIEMGHFHSENNLSGIHTKTFVNGSLKGLDEYSLKSFGSGRGAAQTLLTFHPKRGWTGQYAMQLQEYIPASEGWNAILPAGEGWA
jgi:regulator of replication initiation timing